MDNDAEFYTRLATVTFGLWAVVTLTLGLFRCFRLAIAGLSAPLFLLAISVLPRSLDTSGQPNLPLRLPPPLRGGLGRGFPKPIYCDFGQRTFADLFVTTHGGRTTALTLNETMRQMVKEIERFLMETSPAVPAPPPPSPRRGREPERKSMGSAIDSYTALGTTEFGFLIGSWRAASFVR